MNVVLIYEQKEVKHGSSFASYNYKNLGYP